MTNRQKQCLLCLLGLYNGPIDGIWGKGSRQAEEAFVRIHGECTGESLLKALEQLLEDLDAPENFWETVPNFTREEFRCKCGGKHCDGFPAEPSRKLVTLAQRVRAHFGAPAVISSGVRCPTHNAKVGGVSGSRHLSGTAMDFCVAGIPARQVLEYVHAQPETRYAYDIDGLYLHMDVAEA